MDHLHSPTQKRPLIEETSLPTPDVAHPPSDQQTKRLRILPPISVTPPQAPPNAFQPKFQLPIPPTLLDSNATSLSNLSLNPLSATDSPVLPITSPRAISSQQQELPSIDSLGPLPPIPHFVSTTPPNSMSISAILSNNDEPFIRKLDMNIKEIGIGNNLTQQHNSHDYSNLHHSLIFEHSVDENSNDIHTEELAEKQADKEPDQNDIDDGTQDLNSDNADDSVNDYQSENNREVGEEGNESEEDNQSDEFSFDYSLFEGINLQREPHLIVQNDEALNMEGREERHLGHIIYNPKEILPPLEFHENGLLEIWISSKHLTWKNNKVRSQFLWGTDVYTDDSDIIAVLIHTGHYIPPPPNSPNYPDHDLCVTIRVLPKLVQYTATVRNHYQSRSWGNHHGVSYKVESVRKMKNGEAIGRSIGHGRKERLRRFHKMRKRAFEESELSQSEDPVIVFNNEGDPCFKYTPQLMADDESVRERLRTKVMYLENDDERYEISYDETRDKYRFAIVSSAVHLGPPVPLKDQNSTDKGQIFPLPSNLEDSFRDDLDYHEMTWNIVGVIVADKTNPLHSLLCISKRVFWRDRTV
ncbi:Rxt3-domain-containing protein [Gigaspora margarita]|uniref:Rxt3-domain-containing protein n=1 Tax=Gigaspora margarita TaxID=4874 RepID=A0A8H3X0A5_GIGMA|nr:Rxt3-domain-containing protein [Gigaspora margarita]